MALYGAPIWAQEASRSRKVQTYLRSAQRKILIRVIRAYRTVSYVGSTLLAGVAPLELMAARHSEAYNKTRQMRARIGRELSASVAAHIKDQADLRLR